MFYEDSSYSLKDGYFFEKYFDNIMNSRKHGVRIGNLISQDLQNHLRTIVEIGLGTGSTLQGFRSVMGDRFDYYGLEPNTHLIQCAPEWIITDSTSISDIKEIPKSSLVIISPCLFETIRENTHITNIIRMILDFKNCIGIVFTVHDSIGYRKNCTEKPSTFCINQRKVTIETLNEKENTLKILWKVENAQLKIYERIYTIKLRSMHFWNSVVENFSKEMNSISFNDGDNRIGFLLYKKLS